MGKRDFRHHETKKAKKDTKKAVVLTAPLAPPPEVEVIKKGKKAHPEEVEEA